MQKISNFLAGPNPKVVLSFDIEACGKAPGLGSMLNIGFVGLTVEAQPQVVLQFEANLKELPDAPQKLADHTWWQQPEQAEALAYITKNPQDPEETMKCLADALKEFLHVFGKDNVIVVAWPAAYDWAWLNYYFERFNGSNPLGYSCRDVGSYYWGKQKQLQPSSPNLVKFKLEHANLLSEEFKSLPQHSGLIDACWQGLAFVKELYDHTH